MMRLSQLIAISSLALLAACAGNPETASGPSATRGSDSSTSETKLDQQALAPLGSVTEPSRLKGLNPLQVRSVLGKPGFTRRDAPAEIWQYRAHACTLDLFLYDEGLGQTVAHYAVRGTQPVSERDCFNELLGRDRGIPTS
jgi:hypothetical protein